MRKTVSKKEIITFKLFYFTFYLKEDLNRNGTSVMIIYKNFLNQRVKDGLDGKKAKKGLDIVL